MAERDRRAANVKRNAAHGETAINDIMNFGREAGMPSGRTVHPAARYDEHGRYDGDEDDGRDFEGEIEARDYAFHGSGEDVMTMGVKGW